MTEPEWLLPEAVVAIHAELIAEHGGLSGFIDEGLLDSAFARPRNRLAVDPGATLFDLAAAYACGISKNHPFVDGNKRVAFTVVGMFLRINGWRFRPDRMDALRMTMGLAAGQVDEPDMARWIEANCSPIR